MKTPEEIDRLELLAASYACDYRDSPNKTNGIPDSYLVYSIAYDAFLAGYKAAMDEVEAYKDGAKDVAKKFNELIAAKDQVADASKVITYDYVETASDEARELIAKFELKGNEEVLVKALVAAYCRGVDAVDGYLRNSLGAYRASVKQQQWISVKDRLPEDGVGWTMVYGCILSRWSVQPGFYDRQREEWISRFINGYEDEEGYARLESVTHWMTLPSVEGLKNED